MHWLRKLSGLLRRWLAALCLLPAGLGDAAAEEFRTPSISAVRVEWRAVARSAPHRDRHPAGDRFPIYVRRPAARAGMGSAFNARAGAAERRSTQACSPGSDAARCRCCCRSIPRATSKTRPTARSCRCRATRPTSAPQTCFTPVPPATTRCFRCNPARAAQRTFARPVEVQITGSILDLRPRRSARRQGRAGQGAGGAVPRHAPLHPRRLCALRLHPLRRALCGVDPVPRFSAAGAAAGLPRGLSRLPSVF